MLPLNVAGMPATLQTLICRNNAQFSRCDWRRNTANCHGRKPTINEKSKPLSAKTTIRCEKNPNGIRSWNRPIEFRRSTGQLAGSLIVPHVPMRHSAFEGGYSIGNGKPPRNSSASCQIVF
jgi:hypothetical protein